MIFKCKKKLKVFYKVQYSDDLAGKLANIDLILIG